MTLITEITNAATCRELRATLERFKYIHFIGYEYTLNCLFTRYMYLQCNNKLQFGNKKVSNETLAPK